MLIKTNSIEINDFKTHTPLDMSRVYIDGAYTVLIGNSDKEYIFYLYENGVAIKTISIDYNEGVLEAVYHFNGDIWIELVDKIELYFEKHTVARLNKDGFQPVMSFKRESYYHDNQYCSVFKHNGEIVINVIRHNRIHQYRFYGNELVEVECIENGIWYLCGEYCLCHSGNTVEIFNQELEFCEAFDYDYDINSVNWAVSSTGDIFTAVLADIQYKQSAICVYQSASHECSLVYTEYGVADLGMSAGKLIVNPYSFNSMHDYGGICIFDKNAWQLYTHTRLRYGSSPSVGAYPPPFHRSSLISQFGAGQTVVVDENRLKILDHNYYNVQDIPIAHPDCVGIDTCGMAAILKVSKAPYLSGEPITHKDAIIDIYSETDRREDTKVIEMANFYDK